jgi:aminocarboxymuconate-semialdehyde decarboxylase
MLSQPAADDRPLIIDVHSHWYPPAYVDRLRRRRQAPLIKREGRRDLFVILPDDPGREISESFWDLACKLAYMDAAGIAHSIVSVGNPWLDAFEADEGLGLAQELNGELAALRGQTDGRLLGLGVLPPVSITNAVNVVTDIGKDPNLYGVIIGTRPTGRQLDDRELDPLWAALEGIGKPAFIHPHYCIGAGDLGGYGHTLPLGLGFPMETTVALARLLLGGVVQRHPDLKLAAAHGGGALPFLAGRLDAFWRHDARFDGGAGLTSHFQSLFLDVLVYSEASMIAAASLVGAHRLGFGSDHPFGIGNPLELIAQINTTFAGRERASVLGAAAADFFRLPVATRTSAS